jgi:Asp-tRNA(Asn)/Glu-tRNA(Gln) amidotransferase C subunit
MYGIQTASNAAVDVSSRRLTVHNVNYWSLHREDEERPELRLLALLKNRKETADVKI